MQKITLVLVDDHRLLRESWHGILNNDSLLLVIGHTGNGAEAIEMVKTLKPDIVLMDINMEPIDGFEVTRQIYKGECRTRVIGLSIYNNIIAVRRLLELGAMGYLTKNSSKEEMIKAIKEVSIGNKYICEEVKDALFHHGLEAGNLGLLLKSLSEREIEIVQYVKTGLCSREIALKLDISTKTVEAHRYSVLKKLKLKNRASLINFFNVNGI